MNAPPCNRQPSPQLTGELVAFTVGTGNVLWRKSIAPSESSPVVEAGSVFVGDWSGRVYAFRKRTGRLYWSTKLHGQVKGAIAVAGERAYVADYSGHVYALNVRTGRIVWQAAAQPRFGHAGNFYSTPAVAYGRVYIGATDGKVYSFGASSGKLRWSQSTGGYVYSSPAVWRDRVFAGSYSHRFFAFDAATGAILWQFKANGPISGSPTVIAGRVYFATLAGTTYALDARTGAQLWTFPDGKYSPVVADANRLYLVGNARLYGLDEMRGQTARTPERRVGARHPPAGRFPTAEAHGHAPVDDPHRRRQRSFAGGTSATSHCSGRNRTWSGQPLCWEGLPLMRFIVTGAAGFIGSHLGEALAGARRRGRGTRLLHRLLRPGAQARECSWARCPQRRSGHDRSTSAASTACSTSPGQPGVRSFGDVFPLYLRRNVLASQRVFEAAARDGVKVVFASSSSVYGAAERYPTPEETPPQPAIAIRDHQAGVRAPRRRLRAPVRPRLRGRALLQRVRAATASRHGVHPHRQRARHAAARSTCLATGRSRARWTYVDDLVEGTIAALSAARDLQRRRRARGIDERVDRALRACLREDARGAAQDQPVPGDQQRTKADTTRIRASSAGSLA